MPRSSCRSIPVRITDKIMVARVARQHLAADDSKVLLEEALAHLREYRTWSATFDATLKQARREDSEDLPPNFVWQDDLVEFWVHFTDTQRELLALYDSIEEVNPHLAARVEEFLDPPAKAQIEYATELSEFFTREGYPRKQIAYDIRRLQVWHANFSNWLEIATRGLRAATSKL